MLDFGKYALISKITYEMKEHRVGINAIYF